MNGWIALNRCEETDSLQREYPNAFLLLSLIARRARWKEEACPITGLVFGEAFIGDWKEAGLKSEKIYRTAKSRLAESSLCDFRRAAQGAKRGTIATLTDQVIYTLTKNIRAEQMAEQGRDEGGARATKKKVRREHKNKEREATPPPSLSSFEFVEEKLAKIFPSALCPMEKNEKDLVLDLMPRFEKLEPDDWEALICWFVHADDKARGRNRWPRSREEFLSNATEAIEKVREWWKESGKAWHSAKLAKEKKREERVNAEQEEQSNSEPPMTPEEALAFMKE